MSLLAGEGSGLAIAGAYVLAGELDHAEGNHAAAFTLYQQRMMPFFKGKQKSAADFASSFAPASAFGLSVRNLASRLMSAPFFADLVIGRDLRDDIVLPDYAQN